MGERAERAVAYFRKGCNCAQSVFCAFAEDYGFEEETAMRLSASFGAGVGRMRGMCGAFSGICLVEGLESGAEDPADQMQKGENYRRVQQLAEQFKERNGSLLCRELLGLSEEMQAAESSAPRPRTREYYETRPCPQIIRRAAELLEERYPRAGEGTG